MPLDSFVRQSYRWLVERTEAVVQFVRFNVVGIATGVTFWATYELFYWVVLSQAYRVESAWVVAYAINSVMAHFLHFRITFQPGRTYLPSFWRCMLIYVSSLIGSTISEYVLVREFALHHRWAWFINASVFGFINFFLLRAFAFDDLTRRGKPSS